MNENQKEIQHFILTRFNLLLWHQSKDGQKVRTKKWLEHRFLLFEKYCLPSLKNQTCQDFEWIVLFDNMTPDAFKARIAAYQKDFPQLIPVYVEPEKGRFFAEIFREEIVKRLYAKRVISTYLDNDDALNLAFVEDLQHRALSEGDGTFFYYDKGYQFYSDHKYLMRIHFPRNHFVSVVENGDAATVKGIFGYGRHYYIDLIEGAKKVHVKKVPMWCEVIHEKNMCNDAYYIGAKMVKDEETLRKDFGIDETVKYGTGIYLRRFIPRYCKTFVKRTKHYFLGRHW